MPLIGSANRPIGSSNAAFGSANKGLALLFAGLAALAVLTFAPAANAQQNGHYTSLARMNGVTYPVYYNDGDTFRPLAGPWRQRPARLAGFNTLESYGPVHRWGGWTYKELFVNAKQATYNARRQIWNCKVDDSQKDGYGRILAKCLDLGVDQVKKGLAHAYNIGKPADWRLIQAQREAIVNRRGMWAKGVPPMVLTSLHSVDERINNDKNYNRLISPLDGLSDKWKHQISFQECQEVCHMGKVSSKAAKLKVIAALRADPKTEAAVRGYEDPYLMALLDEFTSQDRVAQIFVREGHIAVGKKLRALLASGAFGTLETVKGSCMVYVPFVRWYRVKPKPKCLKW
jgi:endonuclease YncB( thermonuclease family)